jgi:polysaccharide deacetylase 2 family uncharacterized protein YibQ
LDDGRELIAPRQGTYSGLARILDASRVRDGLRRALEHARTLAARKGAERRRARAADRGVDGVVAWLADALRRDVEPVSVNF